MPERSAEQIAVLTTERRERGLELRLGGGGEPEADAEGVTRVGLAHRQRLVLELGDERAGAAHREIELGL